MGKKDKDLPLSAGPSTPYYCRYCECDLQSKEVFDHHVTGKKHKKAEQAIKEMYAVKCRIFIGGTNRNAEPALFDYFSQFGTVESLKFGRNFDCAFLEFNSPQSVPRVLKQQVHRYLNFRWRVRQFENHYPNPKQQAEEKKQVEQQKEKQKNTVIGMLTKTQTIPEQFTVLTDTLKLTTNCFETRKAICQELTRTLSVYFKGCQVVQFGSSINGYGMKGCDLDLFLEIDNHQPSAHNHTVDDMPILPPPLKSCDVKSLTRNRSHISQEQIEVLEDIDKVRLMQQIFRTSHSIKDLFLIPSKRCPLIRFTHKASGLKCDLSLNNRKALYNSRLLKLYSHDPRVQQLVITVRSWARIQKLSGLEECGPVFTSYATTWLVLFYLMKRKPKVIPLVEELHTLLSDQGVIEEMVESVKCLDIPLTAQLPPSQNTETVAELLLGFFQYYATEVNWDVNALSTFDSQIIPKSVLSQDAAFCDLKRGQMVMLDPFVLSHNILGNVSEKIKLRFELEVKEAAGIVSKWQQKSSPGLPGLLKPSKVENSPEYKAIVKKLEEEKDKMKGIFTIKLNPDPALLSSEAFLKISQSLDVIPSDLWTLLTQKVLVDLLETVFYTEMKEEAVEVAWVKQENNEMKETINTDENTDALLDDNSSMKDIDAAKNCGSVHVEERVKETESINDDLEDKSSLTHDRASDILEGEISDESNVSTILHPAGIGLMNNKETGMEEDGSVDCESVNSSDVVVENEESAHNISAGSDTLSSQNESEMDEDNVRNCDSSKRSAQSVQNNETKRFKPQDGEQAVENCELHIAQPKDLMLTKLVAVTPKELDGNNVSGARSKGAKVVAKSSKNKTVMDKKSKRKSTTTNDEAVPVDMEMATNRIVGLDYKVSKIMSYSCKISKPMWTHRNQVKQTITNASDFKRLELEREISKKVLEKLSANKEPKTPKTTAASKSEQDSQNHPNKVLEKLTKLSEISGMTSSNTKTLTTPDTDSTSLSSPSLDSQENKSNDKECSKTEGDIPIEFQLRIVHSVCTVSSQPRIFFIMGTKQDKLLKNFFNAANAMIPQIVHSHLLEESVEEK